MPASFRTFRCCETAGRLTGRPCASSPTDRGPRERRSSTSRRVGSARAAKARLLVMTYRKSRLTRESSGQNKAGFRRLKGGGPGRAELARPVRIWLGPLLLRQHLLQLGLGGVDRRRSARHAQLGGIDREGV